MIIIETHNEDHNDHMNRFYISQAIYVQNCYSGDKDKLPFPEASKASGLLKDILDKRVLRILASGTPDDKPNWHEDGNYQVDPPTGKIELLKNLLSGPCYMSSPY